MARWTNDLLDEMHKLGDPEADAVIQEIFEDDSIDEVNRLMLLMVENDDMPSDELPKIMQDFLRDTAKFPAWVDEEKMLHGSQLFTRYGPEIVLILFGASLPILYAAYPGAQVLVGTRRLTADVHRRIIETGQFVIDVTAESAWRDDGKGFRTTQKIRLMHATIRQMLSHHPRWEKHWDDDWGVPINQEDLAGTMLSFSVTIIQSLEKCNITMSDEEKEAYLHHWKVIGHILGVEDELMPDNYQEAVEGMALWMRRNHKETEAAKELMAAMVKFWYDRVPGKLFDGVTTGWSRMWVGDKLADTLGIPKYNWTYNLLQIQRFIWLIEDKVEDRIPFLQWFTRFWTRRLMTTLMAIERGGKRPPFNIPEELQKNWGMK